MNFHNGRNVGKLAVFSIWGPEKKLKVHRCLKIGVNIFFCYPSLPFKLVEKYIEYNKRT